MSNLDPIKDRLLEYCDAELEPAKNQRGFYVCPLCGSGTGANKTAAFSIQPDGLRWRCFACKESGDIFDLEAKRKRSSLLDATRALLARYGSAPVPPFKSSTPAEDFKPLKDDPAPAKDYSAMLSACHAALKGSEGETYLRQRGFSDETMERFNLGYDPAHYFPGRGSFPAIVFPYDRAGHYVGWRAIAAKHYDKPKTLEAGKEPVFNAAALYAGGPVFVVESQLCAISIEQSGGHAVAIGGAGDGALLLKVKEKAPAGPLLLSLDNDEPGKAAQAKLASALAAVGVPFIEFNVADDCKDPNELLQKEPAKLAALVDAGSYAAGLAADRESADYEASTTSASFDQYEKFLSETGGRPPIPTGFDSLDRILNGGLSAGLYIMGAISSLGKTSWMLNIADNIAAAGYDVLYFSLEMSRNELISKSLSRLSFKSGKEGLTTFEVMNSKGKVSLTFEQNASLSRAICAYKDGPGRHMWIREGVGNFGVDTIREDVEKHIRLTGRVPVVFVDYLQILAPADPRSTDKQNTDHAVVELKRLSAAHDVPIFCISSLNRASYTEPIGPAAFKESGAIEYGSDVLLGMQVLGMDYEPSETQKAHGGRVRKVLDAAEQADEIDIHVKVLKNRNGRRASAKMSFNKKFNTFRDVALEFTPFYGATPFDDEEEQQSKKKLPVL